jgi:ribosomal protein S18 acetylase RimI-like enzyme
MIPPRTRGAYPTPATAAAAVQGGVKTDFEVRPLGPGDERALTRHIAVHTAESGANGDPVFSPLLEVNEEDLERTMFERLRTSMGEPGWFRAWGAFEGDALVGHVDLRGETLATAAHRAHLGIGVLAAARGRGVGRALMGVALDLARSRPELRWVDLYVFAHNAPAIALYRSLGFGEVGRTEERFLVRGEPVDDVHMVLDLRSS